jgi:putative flippase GtrA
MQIPLRRLLAGRFRHAASPARLMLIAQFARFSIVGAAGFVVDTATVYGLRYTLGLYGAGMVAYITAASGNWALNRIWTFRGQGNGPPHRQWAMFMLTNLVGFTLNRGTYVLLVTCLTAAADQPVIATAAGAVAGRFVNFGLSRRLVFR